MNGFIQVLVVSSVSAVTISALLTLFKRILNFDDSRIQ